MLEIVDLTVAYGGIVALDGVSVSAAKGEFVAIVGPNGAGKTTLFKTISGVVVPRSGRILFEGRDIVALEPSRRPHLGIAHVPEGRQVFASLSVMENLEMGAYTEAGRARFGKTLEYVFSLFPILAERRSQAAGTLSGGEQQMLAIGRALASAPTIILLDEPSMGLAPTIADMIFERIVEMRSEWDLTVLLVEQRVVEALESCDRGYVLENGRVVLSGGQAELLSDDRVRQAYLGM